MEVHVDPELCIGCGLCISTAPEVYRMDDDGKAEVFAQPLPESELIAQDAADACPVAAISSTLPE